MYPLPLWFWIIGVPCVLLCFILEHRALGRQDQHRRDRRRHEP
jgi:hypothetical protein